MQVCQVYEDIVEVADRLGQLRMPAEAIAEAVYQGHLHRVRLTPKSSGDFPRYGNVGLDSELAA